MGTVIHEFFPPDQVQRLEAGLPRLEQWSECMLVPFQVRQLRLARVLWINDRWFLERGFDLTREGTRDRISEWLLHEFGYVVPTHRDPSDAFTGKVRTLHADRYGSSNGTSVHGGSGRVATVGCYQAKGIGVTPLAGIGANWVHSHGCASIEEAIREAIFSEVAHAEFPHGALPIVAVLDTGLYFSDASRSGVAAQEMRRAIIVRPAALRLAHAQRAPAFTGSTTGQPNRQLDDVRRTKDVIRRWLSECQSEPSDGTQLPSPNVLVRRIAEQVAFGQVHRLFNGGYFSSNLSACGALLDFGGMRALPNWARAKTLDHVGGFGDEMKVLTHVIESLTFYFNKFRSETTAPVQAAALCSEAIAAHTRMFTNECLRLWHAINLGDSELANTITEAVRRYFQQQQKMQSNYKHGILIKQAWLHDIIGGNDSRPNCSAEMQTVKEIQAALRTHFASSSDDGRESLRAWWAASRYLKPREALDREELQRRINRMLSTHDTCTAPRAELVRDFIRNAVGTSRRHWPRLPTNLTVTAHVSYEGSSALRCEDLGTGRCVLWLEGIRAQDRCHWFDSILSPDEAQDLQAQYDGAHWTAKVPVSRVEELSGTTLNVRGRTLAIPKMQVEYPEPAPWLACAESRHESAATV